MNRRRLLKSMFALIALIPFVSWRKEQRGPDEVKTIFVVRAEQTYPVALSIDKAKSGEDKTIFVVRADTSGYDRISPLPSQDLITLGPGSGDVDIDFSVWHREHNCCCAFELKVDNERL